MQNLSKKLSDLLQKKKQSNVTKQSHDNGRKLEVGQDLSESMKLNVVCIVHESHAV